MSAHIALLEIGSGVATVAVLAVARRVWKVAGDLRQALQEVQKFTEAVSRARRLELLVRHDSRRLERIAEQLGTDTRPAGRPPLEEWLHDQLGRASGGR